MVRPARSAALPATIVGTVHVAIVMALLHRFGYPAFDTVPRLALISLTAFALGYVPALISASTRLVSPAIGFGLLFAGVVTAEVTTPAPSWSEFQGFLVVEGPIPLWHYVRTWYVWSSLLLVVAVVEFALRRWHAVGGDSIRHLPPLPLPRSTIARVSIGFGGLFALSVLILVLRLGISPRSLAVVVLVGAFFVAVIPLAGALSSGLVSPIVLFLLVVPYVLIVDVFASTDSPVLFLTLPVVAIVLGLAGLIEGRVRPNPRGRRGFSANENE